MIKRKILEDLENWKHNPSRKPLVLRGARQVGKTTVINEFGKTYPQYVYLNLEKNEDKKLFEDFDDVETLVQALFFQKGKKRNNTTLIFIDEIQESSKAISLLRYFYEQTPEIHVIAAGSLLENVFNHKVNFPVGRVEYRILRPLSFCEFLEAMGESDANDIMVQIPLPSFSHQKILSLFHTYSIIGGMPEVVKEYVKHRDFTSLERIYEGLIIAYTDDVEKYSSGKQRGQIIRAVMKSIFENAGKRIKFEGFGNTNYKSREIGEALRTLEKAMLLNLIYPTTNFKPPISADHKKSPRLQVLDTGLLNFYSGIQKGLPGISDLTDAYQGVVAEHIVGQELLALNNSVLNSLVFWARDKAQSSAEVDFVCNHYGQIVPLEVKSGKKGKLRSLQLFMENVEHQLAVRLYPGELKTDQIEMANGKSFQLLNLPYFLVHKLPEYLNWLESKV